MSSVPTASRVNIPTPGYIASKNRRRPALIALAVAFLLLSALAGWWAFTQISTTTAVVGVRESITRGEVIEREDLVIMQVSNDPQQSTIPAEELEQVIGRRAATDLPAGVTVPREAFTDALVPPKGRAVIGVVTKGGSAPRTGLVKGARVTLVPLAGSTGDTTPEEPGSSTSSSPPPSTNTPAPDDESAGSVEGTVVDVVDNGDGTGRVDIEVDAAQAGELQRLAAEDKLALVVESQER
ncbi:SAF domain-containing protein [Propionibacteriaceae bacterium Y1685]|uniref:SAF domain-containing protein n=1 Tax=Microlunatus sp. Y1700 TaxID=3418487 RepID=UPI003B822A3E